MGREIVFKMSKLTWEIYLYFESQFDQIKEKSREASVTLITTLKLRSEVFLIVFSIKNYWISIYVYNCVHNSIYM